MAPQTNVLDHIVHLTPPGTVAAATEQWRALGFTVVPGGTHADGLTSNALVVFQDGVYIELISFVHPISYYPPDSPARLAQERHAWGHKTPGWIDYAFLGTSEKLSEVINDRAQHEKSGVEYLPEQTGGRERPDGKVLKWRITAPERLRGTWPFFCGDITPREWRVPLKPVSNAVHPSGALGIAHVRLLAYDTAIADLARHFTSIIGASPIQDKPLAWRLATPITLQSDPAAEIRVSAPILLLSVPQDEEEQSHLKERGSGLYELALWVEDGNGKKGGDSDDTPYAKVVWKAINV
ncbi:hypothetical protein NEOLEDRAFT_1068215 [Neolentinus lepideus HHB14362 ss-1]|uniref:Glyoxalase-like domain-containing protein n=1 Tax=Neolentinus lepideus HHB14362 ss-1 TaxID=1314782 RepID=A0A165RN53_9AGAM|nr:hypothetical protein NEOLEDRAFT_1068215 [Neolentinus lepideus HHB14362 ss-1]